MSESKAAKVTLRMSPQLHDALRASALESGCSLNQFAIQVLASAAGHRARFRGTAETGPTSEEAGVELRELSRNDQGFPLERTARSEHAHARERYRNTLLREMTMGQAAGVIRRIDESEPWFYVEREMESG
jgi:hypothetical protein